MNDISRALMIFAVLFGLLTLAAIAKAEGPVIDPTVTPTVTITCSLPVTREDGSPLAVGEIAEIRFHQSADGASWVQDGSSAECRTVLDAGVMGEGQYYYTATAVDTEGRESQRGTPTPFVLYRIRPPSPPTGLSIQAS